MSYTNSSPTERALYAMARACIRLAGRLYPESEPESYDACNATPRSWGGGELPFCCEPRGHKGAHVDSAFIFRWQDPIMISFPCGPD